MHRIEGENVDVSTGVNLFTETPPFTVASPAWCNAVQEEIMNVIINAGLPILGENADKNYRNQLWTAIQSTGKSWDVIVSTQAQFNDLFERTAANSYQIKSTYTNVLFTPATAGYSVSSILSDGDTWGDLYTNACTHLEFINGAFINFGNIIGNLTVNTNDCYLKNVHIQGMASSAVAITESFKLNAYRVVFDNCRCSLRLSSTAMAGFRGSSTAAHNNTSKYVNCSVYDMTTTHANKVIQGFVNTKNKKNCLEYNFDNTGTYLQVEDPRKQWTSARQVGNGLTISTTALPALAALNGTDIAFIDSGNRDLRTYRFDGANWSQVGNDLNIVGTSPPALAALNGTDVAFVDEGNDNLRTYRFDGTNWAQVGSGLSLLGMGNPAIAALNETDIAFIDTTNRDLRTYRWNGSAWTQVGNDLNLSISTPAITALNGTDIAFIDLGNDDLRVYRFDGSDWAQVGNDLNFSGGIGNPALAALNGTDIAFIDSTNDDLRVYRFDGSDWAQVGYDLNITGVGNPALTTLNETDVAFIDLTNDNLRLYRFDYGLRDSDQPYGRGDLL